MLPVKNLKFRTDAEARQFAAGMAEANRKLEGHHRETYEEKSARVLEEGHAEILRKLGRVGYAKQFGKAPDPKLVVKVYGVPAAPPRPAAPTAPARKNYSNLTVHRYANRNWLPAMV